MASMGIRILNILIGIVIIILAIVSFFFPIEFLWIVMLIVSIALMIAGIGLVVEGIIQKDWSMIYRIFGFVAGILAIILAIIVFIGSFSNPELAATLFVLLIASILLALGIFRIVEGFSDDKLSKWSKIFLIVVGILMIVFSIIIFITPIYGAVFILIFIQISPFVVGGMRIFKGFAPESEE